MKTIEQILWRKGSDVIGTGPRTTVAEAARIMMEANVGCLVVEQQPDVLGVFTERALVRVVAAGKAPTRTYLAEAMSCPVATCAPADAAADCARRMAEEHIRHLVVIEVARVVIEVVGEREPV